MSEPAPAPAPTPAPVKKVSFAKVGAAPVVPVEPTPPAKAPEANAELTSSAGTDTRMSAPAPTRSPTVFDGGEDHDENDDRSDIRLPRLNIIQGLSGPELKKVGPDGTLVLKKTLALPQPLRIVVAGCSKKRYAEKMAKYGEGKPRIFDTLEEVVNVGGTDQWRQSREHIDKEDNPVSRKPWFTPMVTALLLIQKPEGLKPEDEEHFNAISTDGIAFAPCLYTVKSTSFGSFYVPLKTEQTTGILRNGYYTRYVSLKTKQVRAFEPVVEILGELTSEPVRVLARALLT